MKIASRPVKDQRVITWPRNSVWLMKQAYKTPLQAVYGGILLITSSFQLLYHIILSFPKSYSAEIGEKKERKLPALRRTHCPEQLPLLKVIILKSAQDYTILSIFKIHMKYLQQLPEA